MFQIHKDVLTREGKHTVQGFGEGVKLHLLIQWVNGSSRVCHKAKTVRQRRSTRREDWKDKRKYLSWASNFVFKSWHWISGPILAPCLRYCGYFTLCSQKSLSRREDKNNCKSSNKNTVPVGGDKVNQEICPIREKTIVVQVILGEADAGNGVQWWYM